MTAPQRPRHRLRRVVAVVLGLGSVAVAGVAAPAAWAWWQARDRVLTEAQAPAREVAIIFGAEVYPSGRPSPYLKARLDLGVELFQAGKARVLLVSGDDSAEHHREAASMKRYLVSAGIPAGKVVVDSHGLDTYDTCVRARDVFGLTDAILVSQRYHLTRAVATCRAVGVDAVGVGDVSVKRTSGKWDEFVLREYGANLKMVWDLASHRTPTLEPPSTAVRDALAR